GHGALRGCESSGSPGVSIPSKRPGAGRVQGAGGYDRERARARADRRELGPRGPAGPGDRPRGFLGPLVPALPSHRPQPRGPVRGVAGPGQGGKAERGRRPPGGGALPDLLDPDPAGVPGRPARGAAGGRAPQAGDRLPDRAPARHRGSRVRGLMTEVRGGAVPDVPDGDPRAALSRALVEEGDRLYGLAFRVTRDPDLAADAVQEAFASALDHIDGF